MAKGNIFSKCGGGKHSSLGYRTYPACVKGKGMKRGGARGRTTGTGTRRRSSGISIRGTRYVPAKQCMTRKKFASKKRTMAKMATRSGKTHTATAKRIRKIKF